MYSFLIIKPTRCTNFSNLFLEETLYVSDSSSVHHQEFLAVHTVKVYVIQVCWQLASRIRTFQLANRIGTFYPDPARKLSANLYDIDHCCVYSEKSWWWTEELSETCTVFSRNKFESASSWFYYKNLSWCMVTWTSILYWNDTQRPSV